MKQMRSRFRLITLLLVCAFLLTMAVCTGSALKSAGITLASLASLPGSLVSVSPAPEGTAGGLPGTESTPAPSESVSPETALPGTDNSPDPEYNTFGL